MEKTLHEKLIDELLDPRAALSPREVAAANEIRALREKLRLFDIPSNAKPLLESSKGRRVKREAAES